MFEYSNSDAEALELQETRETEKAPRSLALEIFGRLLRARLNADRYEHYYQTINERKRHANYHG